MTLSPSPEPVNGSEAARSEWQNNAAAFFSLATTQRRLAIRYRILAANAGSLEEFRRYRAEAKRLWNEARGHSEAGQHHLDMHERTRRGARPAH